MTRRQPDDPLAGNPGTGRASPAGARGGRRGARVRRLPELAPADRGAVTGWICVPGRRLYVQSPSPVGAGPSTSGDPAVPSGRPRP